MSGTTDAEIERLAELCWRAYWTGNGGPDWRSSGWGRQLRAVARAVIADRAAQIDGLSNLLTDAETQQSYVRLRDAARSFAQVVRDETPAGADQTAAIRKLRECVMTANAAIACHVEDL